MNYDQMTLGELIAERAAIDAAIATLSTAADDECADGLPFSDGATFSDGTGFA